MYNHCLNPISAVGLDQLDEKRECGDCKEQTLFLCEAQRCTRWS